MTNKSKEAPKTTLLPNEISHEVHRRAERINEILLKSLPVTIKKKFKYSRISEYSF